jgi:rubredoxin
VTTPVLPGVTPAWVRAQYTPAVLWRCKVCRITWDTAVERAIERGTRLAVTALTCSPECGAEHQRRARRVYQRTNYRARRGAAWRCPECGVGKAQADRRRARRGLPALAGDAQSCSPECGAERNRRRSRGETLTRARGMRPLYRPRST